LSFPADWSEAAFWEGWLLFVCLFVFAVLGFELRAYNLSHSTSLFFVLGFCQRGCELFAWAGF
jgi:hypothetical protein